MRVNREGLRLIICRSAGLIGAVCWEAGEFVVRCWVIAMGVFRDFGLFWYRLGCSTDDDDSDVELIDCDVFRSATADLDSCSRM